MIMQFYTHCTLYQLILEIILSQSCFSMIDFCFFVLLELLKISEKIQIPAHWIPFPV